MRSVVVIPARMQSSRLPDKPLALIGREPMIVHVWRRGLEADLGPVVVASGDPRIAEAITSRGGIAVDTDPGLPSGSDRVAAALKQFDPGGSFDTVVNLQGDMPTVDPAILRDAVDTLRNTDFDVVTLACPIHDMEELSRSSVVKVAMELIDAEAGIGRAVYFSRAPIPHGAPTYFHHIGLYVYKRDALERFVMSPQGYLECVEKLEQLRALSIGFSIGVQIVNTIPLGVDTEADLAEARLRLRTTSNTT